MNIDIIDASDFVEKLNEMLGGGKYFRFRDDNTIMFAGIVELRNVKLKISYDNIGFVKWYELVADVGNDEGRILWMGSITKVDVSDLLVVVMSILQVSNEIRSKIIKIIERYFGYKVSRISYIDVGVTLWTGGSATLWTGGSALRIKAVSGRIFVEVLLHRNGKIAFVCGGIVSWDEKCPEHIRQAVDGILSAEFMKEVTE